MNAIRRTSFGLTLMELLIVMSILSLLLSWASPNFSLLRQHLHLHSYSRLLVHSISMARSTALKTGHHTLVIPQQQTWATGWHVVMDMNDDGTWDAHDVLLQTVPALRTADTIHIDTRFSPSSHYILFTPAGFPRTQHGAILNGTITLQLSNANPPGAANQPAQSDSSHKNSIVLGSTGRVRLCQPHPTQPDCPDASL